MMPSRGFFRQSCRNRPPFPLPAERKVVPALWGKIGLAPGDVEGFLSAFDRRAKKIVALRGRGDRAPRDRNVLVKGEGHFEIRRPELRDSELTVDLNAARGARSNRA